MVSNIFISLRQTAKIDCIRDLETVWLSLWKTIHVFQFPLQCCKGN